MLIGHGKSLAVVPQYDDLPCNKEGSARLTAGASPFFHEHLCAFAVQIVAAQHHAAFRLEALQQALPSRTAQLPLGSQLLQLGIFEDAQKLFFEMEERERQLKVLTLLPPGTAMVIPDNAFYL